MKIPKIIKQYGKRFIISLSRDEMKILDIKIHDEVIVENE
jgi:hypothetical protein